MELVFSRKNMAKAMKMVSRAAGKSTALPVLSNVLISAAQDPLWNMSGASGNNGASIYLAATDLETGIRTRIPGQIMENGAIGLPVKTFASVINALSEDDVKLITSNSRARIHSRKGEFKMVGVSADEFPSLMGEVSQDDQLELTERPRDESEIYFLSLGSDALGWMVRKTAFAASRDDTRYFLNGVHLSLRSEGDGTMLRIAASDGTRLSVASMMMEQPLEKDLGSPSTRIKLWKSLSKEDIEKGIEAIIPNKAVKELEQLTLSSDVIKIGIQENRIIFDAGDTALVSTLIEGQYPDYQAVIPDDSLMDLKADTGVLMAVIRRISQVSNPKQPYVKLTITENRLKVSADNPYLGDGCEEMDVGSPDERKEKDNLTIAVNASYLMDALGAIDTQETLIGIDSEVKPIIIRPSSGDQEHLCVLMPVRLAAG